MSSFIHGNLHRVFLNINCYANLQKHKRLYLAQIKALCSEKTQPRLLVIRLIQQPEYNKGEPSSLHTFLCVYSKSCLTSVMFTRKSSVFRQAQKERLNPLKPPLAPTIFTIFIRSSDLFLSVWAAPVLEEICACWGKYANAGLRSSRAWLAINTACIENCNC